MSFTKEEIERHERIAKDFRKMGHKEGMKQGKKSKSHSSSNISYKSGNPLKRFAPSKKGRMVISLSRI